MPIIIFPVWLSTLILIGVPTILILIDRWQIRQRPFKWEEMEMLVHIACVSVSACSLAAAIAFVIPVGIYLATDATWLALVIIVILMIVINAITYRPDNNHHSTHNA